MELFLSAKLRVARAAPTACTVLVMLAACGQQTSGAGQGMDDQDARQSAIESYDRWAGSDADREAAELVIAYRLNGELVECIRDQGFDASWRDTATAPEPVDPLSASVWLMAPRSKFYSASPLATAAFLRSQSRANDVLPAAEDEVVGQCDETAASASDSEVDSVRSPAGLKALQAEWDAALGEYGSKFGSTAEYLACLRKADIPALHDGKFSEFDQYMKDAVPSPDDIPVGDEESSPAWERFLELERPLTAADWDCRRQRYAEALPGLNDVVNGFEETHQPQIDRLHEHWLNVRKEAQALG